jgi:hypothetical protein
MTRELEERLESAEALLIKGKKEGFKIWDIQAHFNKYAPKDPLRERWDHLLGGTLSVEADPDKGYKVFRSLFSDFLLTPEHESELKREGWNEALDEVINTGVMLQSDAGDYLKVFKSSLRKIRNTPKGVNNDQRT